MQKLKKLTNIKIIKIAPQQTKIKPKCKKYKCENIQTVLVVDGYARVV
jgi:hypothetical protein